MPLLVWSTWRTGSRTQFTRGEWALCMQSATWEWVWVQNSGYSSSCVGHRHHPNPWARCSSQGSHFWSPDPSTSLTGRSHPARAELLTLQHFSFHQKYKSAPEVLSFENKAPHRPRGSFLGSLMKSLGGAADGRAGTAGSRVSVENNCASLHNLTSGTSAFISQCEPELTGFSPSQVSHPSFLIFPTPLFPKCSSPIHVSKLLQV